LRHGVVAVIKFRMNNGSGSDTGCCRVRVMTDAVKSMDMTMSKAGLRQCRDLIREST